MSLLDKFSKPKTYEMPPGLITVPASLKSAAEIQGLDTYFKYIDVTVKSGLRYPVLHHVNSGLFGWMVELNLPPQEIDDVVNALLAIMGGKIETKPSQSGNKTTINPKVKVSLRELADYVDHYQTKDLKEPTITGYRIENLPASLYKRVIQAGLPLKEVQSK